MKITSRAHNQNRLKKKMSIKGGTWLKLFKKEAKTASGGTRLELANERTLEKLTKK